jgi:putative YphP/YqiW family bacilliredoxin
MSLEEQKTRSLNYCFAGVDKDAVDCKTAHVPFSSIITSYGLIQNGELVHMLERHHIEGRPAELIAENLQDAYNEHC